MKILLLLLTVIQAYLFGSISFAVIFSKLLAKKDIRDYGSGNAGMTNVLRVFGVLPGLLTFLFDAIKAFAACYIGQNIIFEYLYSTYKSPIFEPIYGALLCGIFCMLGRAFPVFFGFKGGKAVAVSVGIFAVADWRGIALALAVFVIVLLIGRIISIASLLATASMPIWIAIFPRENNENLLVVIALVLVMCLIIFLKHIENIKRLIKGEEKPIFGKGK